MWLTILLILATCGLSLANAWISGHAEELAVRETPQRAWLPKAGFWLSVVGLSSTLFAILVPILTSFVNLETDGGYLNPAYFLASLWPLYLLLAAALAVILMMQVNAVRAPKPKASVDGGPQRRYGYYGYPRSFFIFMPMRSHRRIAASPRYYPNLASAPAANAAFTGGMSGAYSGGMTGGMAGGMSNAYSGAMSGGMGSGMGGSTGMVGGMGSGASGMQGGMSSGAQGGMQGGMSSGGQRSYRSNSNNRSMNGNAGLVMLAVIAITGGYRGAKAVKQLGGKRQAEINRLWRVAEAQRVIREHDEEQEQKLHEQFAQALDSES